MRFMLRNWFRSAGLAAAVGMGLPAAPAADETPKPVPIPVAAAPAAPEVAPDPCPAACPAPAADCAPATGCKTCGTSLLGNLLGKHFGGNGLKSLDLFGGLGHKHHKER